MPVYDYHCDHCGHTFEAVGGFNDPPLGACPRCGKTPRRLIAATAIVFKGSGWYKTDSRSAPSEDGALKPAAASTAPSTDGAAANDAATAATGGEKGAESKPAPAKSAGSDAPSSGGSGESGGSSRSGGSGKSGESGAPAKTTSPVAARPAAKSKPAPPR